VHPYRKAQGVGEQLLLNQTEKEQREKREAQTNYHEPSCSTDDFCNHTILFPIE